MARVESEKTQAGDWRGAYGDIAPVSPATRTRAWMEAITGQFYLAVVVAGPVGVLAAKGKRPSEP